MFFSDTAAGVGAPTALAHFNETTTNTVSPINLTNSVNNASVLAAIFEGDRSGPVNSDTMSIYLRLSDSAGTQTIVGQIDIVFTTVADGAGENGDLVFFARVANAVTEMVRLDGSASQVVITNASIAANNSAGIITDQVTFPLINTTATTVNFAGAATTLAIGAATSSTTWTGQSWTVTGANSTNNTTLTVQNTSNAAAASHAILDIQVGGTTSTGDPQLRLTVPGGNSWYIGADNSDADNLFIGEGTVVGTSSRLRINRETSGPNAPFLTVTADNIVSSAANATESGVMLRLVGRTMNINTATPWTAAGIISNLNIPGNTITQSGGAGTVDNYAGLSAAGATAGASVTITHNSALRALLSGAGVNNSNFYGVNQTAGTSRNVQFMLETGQSAPAVLTDFVQIFINDFAAGDARLGIVSELGSPIYIGNDTLLFNANATISRVSVAGVAGSILHDIPVGAGGAADAVVKHEFRLDSGTTVVAGLSSETDGAGSIDTATTIWRVPYRDSGANVAAPGAPAAGNNAAWNGGLRVEAGDDANRLYVFANEAWRYVALT